MRGNSEVYVPHAYISDRPFIPAITEVPNPEPTSNLTISTMTASETPKELSSSQPAPTQPDISYHPDLTNYRARTKRRLETEKLAQELPNGFPRQLGSALVWEGDDFQQDEWVVALAKSEILELDSAIENFKGTVGVSIRAARFEADSAQQPRSRWASYPGQHFHSQRCL